METIKELESNGEVAAQARHGQGKENGIRKMKLLFCMFHAIKGMGEFVRSVPRAARSRKFHMIQVITIMYIFLFDFSFLPYTLRAWNVYNH